MRKLIWYEMMVKERLKGERRNKNWKHILIAVLQWLCGGFAAALRWLCCGFVAALRRLCSGFVAALRHLCGGFVVALKGLFGGFAANLCLERVGERKGFIDQRFQNFIYEKTMV